MSDLNENQVTTSEDAGQSGGAKKSLLALSIESIIERTYQFARVAFSGSYNDLKDKPDSIGGGTTYTLQQDPNDGHIISLVSASGNKHTVTIPDTVYEEATSDCAGLLCAADKSKLDTIAQGAEVNVQADWNQSDSTKDSYIKNKPSSMPSSDVYSWAKSSTKPTYTASEVGADPSGSANTVQGNLDSHVGNAKNPHHVTKSQVGLGNVDNTSDSNKPISTATQSALDNKVDKVSGSSLISSTDLAQISTNKSDISTLKGSGTGSIDKMIDDKIDAWASQLTNDGTVNTYSEAINWIATHASDYTTLLGDVSNKVDKVSGKQLSTEDFTTILKSKLENIAENAQVNVIESISIGGVSQTITGKSVDLPAYPTESTVSGWGFSKTTGTYNKPSTGIPKTDLSNDVQVSLGKADTALQSHQDISGKSDVGHTHDDIYYTESEIDTKLSNKSDTNHTHDDRYYTESEVDDKLDGKSDTDHTHSQYLTSHQDISGKQDAITPTNKLSYSLLSDTPTIPTVPTSLSSFTDDLGSSPTHNHSQYLTSHQDISGKQDKSTAVTHTANTPVGSATKGVYIDTDGVAKAMTYSVNKEVPSDADFDNTWRGVQNNLTSDLTDQSLSAAQGKVLKSLIDGKSSSGHKHTVSDITDFPTITDTHGTLVDTYDSTTKTLTLTIS